VSFALYWSNGSVKPQVTNTILSNQLGGKGGGPGVPASKASYLEKPTAGITGASGPTNKPL
jgi:hypothetical protein